MIPLKDRIKIHIELLKCLKKGMSIEKAVEYAKEKDKR